MPTLRFPSHPTQDGTGPILDPVPSSLLFQVMRNTDDRLEIGANWMRSAEITRGSLDATQLAATLMLEGPSCGLPQTRTPTSVGAWYPSRGRAERSTTSSDG